jgi:putative AdoMet-dependent methyltransferase
LNDDLFPASDFDEWAETYNSCVATNQSFPFEGYTQVLDQVVLLADVRPGMNILDLGTGTGLLAARFEQLGCNLWCTDYSSKMLEKARIRLSQGHFAQHDLRQPWLPAWQQRFDRVVSAYVFHHFEDQLKIDLLLSFAKERLTPDGIIVIADISFTTDEEWASAQQIAGDDWNEELYWVANRVLPPLRSIGLAVTYQQVSYCAGVYCIRPQVVTRKRN